MSSATDIFRPSHAEAIAKWCVEHNVNMSERQCEMAASSQGDVNMVVVSLKKPGADTLCFKLIQDEAGTRWLD